MILINELSVFFKSEEREKIASELFALQLGDRIESSQSNSERDTFFWQIITITFVCDGEYISFFNETRSFWHLPSLRATVDYDSDNFCFKEREKESSTTRQTYRCRSSLSWTFIVAGDTFWLVIHQIRQTFLRLWALITAKSLCKAKTKIN